MRVFAPLGPYIMGKTQSYSKKILKVQITMNGVTKVVPMKTTLDPESFSAVGVIDILGGAGDE